MYRLMCCMQELCTCYVAHFLCEISTSTIGPETNKLTEDAAESWSVTCRPLPAHAVPADLNKTLAKVCQHLSICRTHTQLMQLNHVHSMSTTQHRFVPAPPRAHLTMAPFSVTQQLYFLSMWFMKLKMLQPGGCSSSHSLQYLHAR